MDQRKIPQSVESEELFLSTAIIDGGGVMSKALEKGLTANCFYDPCNRIVYSRLLAMLADGKPIELAALQQELYTHKELDAIGGVPKLVRISGLGTTSANVNYYVDKLKSMQSLRQIIVEGSEMLEACYNYAGQSIPDLLGRPLERLLSLSNGQSEEEELTWPKLVKKAHEMAENIICNKGRPKDRLIPYPWRHMNELFGEPERGDLIVIAGNSSTGKSSLGRQIACHASMNGKKGLIVTLEVNPVKWVLQMAATMSRVGIRELGFAPGDKQTDFKQAVLSLKKAGLHITSRDKWLAQVVARAKAMKASGKIDFLMIDYGGLLKDVATSAQTERVGAIGSVMASLKDLAVNLDIAIFLLWQLNRDNAKGGVNREPVLADLKGASDIEQAADIALLIHRPNDNPLTGGEQGQSSNVTDIPRFFQRVLQSKGRDLGCGSLDFWFNRSIATFEPVNRDEQQANS